tara:strand:- start:23 stop:250 length:228 start_codon:yes stop_codon:yes gene_type:complete
VAVNFKGGFKDRKGVPFVEHQDHHHHPLSSDEIKFLLTILKKSSFTGDEMENLIIITMKLQEEYKKVLDNEEKNK